MTHARVDVWVPDVITGLDVHAIVNPLEYTVIWKTNRQKRWDDKQRIAMDRLALWWVLQEDYHLLAELACSVTVRSAFPNVSEQAT